MKTAIKILAGLVGLFVLANGLAFLIKPELVLGHSGLSANNVFGMSTIRGLIGGSMISTAGLILFALIKSKLELFHPAAFILLSWTFGRVVSLILDGFDKNVLGGGIILSLVMALIVMTAFRVLSKNSEN